MSRSISSRKCARCEKIKANNQFYRNDELCMMCRNAVKRNSQDTRKKKCTKCHEVKLLDEFPTHKVNGKTIIQSDCRECRSKNGSKKMAQRDPLLKRNVHLLWKYGITLAEYNAMLEEQKGLCACCGLPERNVHFGRVKTLVVDHCHVTGAVRGLLCDACNTTIGLMREDPERVAMLLKYIEDRCLW